MDTGPGLEDDGTKTPAESAKKLAKLDDHNNFAAVFRDGTSSSQITITQSDGFLTNMLNFGGSTLIVIRQK